MSTEVTISWPSQPIAKFPADFLDDDFTGLIRDFTFPNSPFCSHEWGEAKTDSRSLRDTR